MLYLNPPFHLIEGVTVYADHADPNQFYFLPAAPHLTVIDGVPQIQLIQFTGSAGSGGFLNFTVDLGISDELFKTVRGKIAGIFNVQGDVLLAPVPLEDGKTRLIMLGKQSDPVPGQPPVVPGGGDPPPPSGLPEFVLKIDHPAKPSLFGNNDAIFSVQLDQAGVTMIKDSFNGVLMPIGIVYELEFLGLRPAFNVHVHANWDRVQTHFEERSSERVLFFSSEVDTIVDKLIEDQVIVIEIDNFVPEGEDGGKVISDPKKVVDQVKDMIFQTFFKPSLDPVSGGKDGWEHATDVATQLSTLAVTGGWAGIATASYVKRDLTRVDKKLFDFNLHERTTVRRSIFPQAHLQGLARVLREGPHTPDEFIRSVDLDDPFFRRRHVHVLNRVDLAADQVASIDVSLRYGTESKSVLLDSTKDNDTLDWASVLVDGAVDKRLLAGYTINFSSAAGALDRPSSLTAETRTIDSDTFEIFPSQDDLYYVVSVPIEASDFPFDRYPQIQVDLRYDDAANGISLRDTLILDAGHTAQTWKWFLRDRNKDTFEYRVTFRAKDNRDVSRDWQPNAEEQVRVRDPRPRSRTVTVVPPPTWSMVSQVFVDLFYDDKPNGVSAEMSMNFNSTAAGPQVFKVAIEDVDMRVVQYEVKLLLSDGSLIQLPRSMTLQNQIFVTMDMRGHRVVALRPQAIDFKGKNVREVRASLHYQDGGNALDYASEFTFKSADEVAFFEYDFLDPQHRAFTVGSKTLFADGFVNARQPQTVDSDTVEIAVA
jgi:hypothetical protein